MLIIPELETVLIQPPRTGSSSIRRAVLARYPRAFQPYRHMERDGCPYGYDRWRMVCLVRHPFARLRSIFRYMADFRPTSRPVASPARRQRLARDVDRSFAAWLAESTEPFTDPFHDDGNYDPFYAVRHSMPIAKKSLWYWARPDLGPIEYWAIEDMAGIAEHLGLDIPHLNAAVAHRHAPRSAAVDAHLAAFFAWDLSLYGENPITWGRAAADRCSPSLEEIRHESRFHGPAA